MCRRKPRSGMAESAEVRALVEKAVPPRGAALRIGVACRGVTRSTNPRRARVETHSPRDPKRESALRVQQLDLEPRPQIVVSLKFGQELPEAGFPHQ